MRLFKQIIALLLACAFITGCVSKTEVGDNRYDSNASTTASASAAVAETNAPNTETSLIVVDEPVMPEFSGLDDTALVSYLEDSVYSQLVAALNSADYFVENVSAAYVSREYLEEIAYNSQENIYFGYTLSEIDEQFQGTRFVFTLGDDGKTEVREFQKYDDTYDRITRNVIIGSGVILLCVTVSVASGGLGAPAVSMIFAASAKNAAIMGLSSGLFSGVTAGVIKGIETHDMDEAVKAAAFAGSESFKWGAISGAVSGGVSEGFALKGATLNGLSMNEAAAIQKESKLPLDIIKSFHSKDEYNVYKNAGLVLQKVNGKDALVQKIDWDFIGDAEDGRTNAQRVADGLSPLGPDGKAYELHHIGQKNDSPLAVLTYKQHRGNARVLNKIKNGSEVDHGYKWRKQVKAFWKDLMTEQMGGAV